MFVFGESDTEVTQGLGNSKKNGGGVHGLRKSMDNQMIKDRKDTLTSTSNAGIFGRTRRSHDNQSPNVMSTLQSADGFGLVKKFMRTN